MSTTQLSAWKPEKDPIQKSCETTKKITQSHKVTKLWLYLSQEELGTKTLGFVTGFVMSFPKDNFFLTQRKLSFIRTAYLLLRRRSRRTGDEDISDTQRHTPASCPQSSSCWSTGVCNSTHTIMHMYMKYYVIF